MSRSQDPARVLRTEKTRREATLTSGINSLKWNISKSIGIGKKPGQQDDAIARMSPSQNKQRTKRTTPNMDSEQPRTNGHTGSQSNSSTNRQLSNAPSVAQPEANLGPLTQELRDASERLSDIQGAIQAIAASCIQHADDITRIPEVRERYENLRQEVEQKDMVIADQKTALDVLNRMASEKDEAAAKDVKAYLADKERLEREREEFNQQKKAAAKELEKKKSELKDEASKSFSRRVAEQDKKFREQMESLEIDLEKRQSDQEEKLSNLEIKNKKGLQTISTLNEEIDKLQHQLEDGVGKYEDANKLKEGYKQDMKELAENLESLREEFSLKSKPLEYYRDKFADISRAIQSISSQYFARELNDKEMAKLPGIIPATDSTFSDVPLSNSETSKQLRIAHAQRVISSAIYNTIWQSYSSDVTAADSRLSDFLREIGASVAISRHESNGNSRSADVWRSITIRALQSMSATDTELQQSQLEGHGTAFTINSREYKLVEVVLSVLSPLLESSDLPQFKADLLLIAKQAISVWTCAQVDERTFIINHTLSQGDKHDWKVAALDCVSLYADGGSSQGAGGSRLRNSTKILTLFPIITATKRVQMEKVGLGPPGSWPDQDKQQASNLEVTIIHNGFGLSEDSELVQRGMEEMEELKRMRLDHEELWAKKLVERHKGHNRNNSTADTISGPPSPSESWSKNKLNNHMTGN